MVVFRAGAFINADGCMNNRTAGRQYYKEKVRSVTPGVEARCTGTKLIEASQSLASDLTLKALIWEDAVAHVHVS